MALLDMQGMQSASRGNGGGGGSELSFAALRQRDQCQPVSLA